MLLSVLSLIVLFTLFGCNVNDNSSGDNLSKGDNGTHNDIMVYDYDEFYHYHDGIKEAHMFGEWEIVFQDDTVIVNIPRFNENKIVYTANFYDSDKTLIESINYYYGVEVTP